jgi:hypothetical protein
MAKTRARANTVKSATHDTASQSASGKLEAFAEDLGNLLGQAQNRAETWLDQRKVIADHLVRVRDTATRLLGQLGLGESQPARRGRPARPDAPPSSAEPKSRPRKRVMSAEARAKIAAAQRARWAKVKKTSQK